MTRVYNPCRGGSLCPPERIFTSVCTCDFSQTVGGGGLACRLGRCFCILPYAEVSAGDPHLGAPSIVGFCKKLMILRSLVGAIHESPAKSDEILRTDKDVRPYAYIKFTLCRVRFFADAQNDKFLQSIGACIARPPNVEGEEITPSDTATPCQLPHRGNDIRFYKFKTSASPQNDKINEEKRAGE